jgi:hypothetical protein
VKFKPPMTGIRMAHATLSYVSLPSIEPNPFRDLTALPSPAMNSLRLIIRSPRRQDRLRHRKAEGLCRFEID